MILSDSDIRKEVAAQRLGITPFEDGQVQPASYDLRVGKDAATVQREGEPIIDLEKEGILMVQPYAPAMVYTMEALEMPLNLVGRFGLKSSLSRRGIYASVGPQVDPGYKGKLSVTLFNLSPVAYALNYGDDFLSLEFTRMSSEASEGYRGPYQSRQTFTAKELEPVLGYKGHHGLTEVVEGFRNVRDELRGVATLAGKFDTFLESYETQNRELTEFNKALLSEMKKLIDHIVSDRPPTVVLRSIPRAQARKEILELFKKSKGPLFYSDIAEQLSLDLELVVELCNELETSGQIGILSRGRR